MKYSDFISTKKKYHYPDGFQVNDINPYLYPFQQAITKWAIRMGRCAIFADCGLGKTLMQIEWAKHIQQNADGQILIVAPICVAEQTIEEATKIGINIVKVSNPTDDKIQITNYEKLHRFLGHPYSGIVLDESSILKNVDGKTRTLIIEQFSHIPYRLACTATPSPNDIAEMGNHAQFLGVTTHKEMIATYFINDNGTSRLKGHAINDFYKWLASWCVFLRSPDDIGIPQHGFDLPELNILNHSVRATCQSPADGQLFAMYEGGIKGRLHARRDSLNDRISKAVDLISSSNEQWVVWHGLNDEGRVLKQQLNSHSVLIEGKDSEQNKIDREYQWRHGNIQCMISKPSIFGFGMNWQHCSNVIFLGLGDSYEQYYQAIRRSWRYGQQNQVNVHVITSDIETNVVENIKRKKQQSEQMASEVISFIGDIEKENILLGNKNEIIPEMTAIEHDPLGKWTMLMGDCVEQLKTLPDDSCHLSIFSPPFAGLYAYSDSPRDMGNSKNYEEFFNHYQYFIEDLMRVTVPGRRCCTHVQQVAATKVHDGYIGWKDFRGDVIRAMIAKGWIYDGEVCIDKNPQVQAIRNKVKALMFVQLHKDSSWSHPAMADYVLLFRKPGDNPVPVIPDIDNETWIQWAHPVWYDIHETDVLSVKEARDDKDERHLTPLQLGLIERCIRLWSNPDETILSPFAGIASEGYVAMKHNRKFIGIELKPSYYYQAVKNLKMVCQPTLFDIGNQC